jgi:hypothetical protein
MEINPKMIGKIPNYFESITEEFTKNDKGKDRWDLLPWRATKEVVKVLTHGSIKYGDENWKLAQVDEARKRYVAAAMRHISAYMGGEKVDSESGIAHLAHAICCLMFILERD